MNKDNKLGFATPPIRGEEPLDIQNQAYHWQTLWPQIIAKCWEEDTFKQQLISAPLKTIHDHFSWFHFPDFVALEIVEATDIDPEAHYERSTGCWAIPYSKLTLVLPPKPKAADAPMALLNYQASGRTFPFSSF